MTEDRTDVAVVGGGITGLSAALHLLEEGARVTVFDAGLNAGSHTNAGSLHVQLQSRLLRLFPELARNVEASLPAYLAAVRAWVALDERLGGVELARNGGLMLAEGPDQMAFLEQKAEREARRGLDVDILDRNEVEKLAPWLGQQIIGAELCRDEGKVNPLAANSSLLSAVRESGGKFVRAGVAGLDHDTDCVWLAHDRGKAKADRVVLAASWGSARLAKGLGACIPVLWEPLHMNITEEADYVIKHLVQHAERPITLKQFCSGRIVIGGGWRATFDPADSTPRVIESSAIGNIALAARLAPGIRALRVMRTWAGLNTTADGKCIVGSLKPAFRVVVAVPGDAGYTLGPLIGRMAADIVLGNHPQLDPSLFSPARFQ